MILCLPAYHYSKQSGNDEKNADWHQLNKSNHLEEHFQIILYSQELSQQVNSKNGANLDDKFHVITIYCVYSSCDYQTFLIQIMKKKGIFFTQCSQNRPQLEKFHKKIANLV